MSNGWTPILAAETVNNEVKLKIVDWIGGEGLKPPVNEYLGASGLLPSSDFATNVRGYSGADGEDGSLVKRYEHEDSYDSSAVDEPISPSDDLKLMEIEIDNTTSLASIFTLLEGSVQIAGTGMIGLLKLKQGNQPDSVSAHADLLSTPFEISGRSQVKVTSDYTVLSTDKRYVSLWLELDALSPAGDYRKEYLNAIPFTTIVKTAI